MGKPQFDPNKPFKPAGTATTQIQEVQEKPPFNSQAGFQPVDAEDAEGETTLIEDIVGGIQAAGEFFDKYTGAPARAAIWEAQHGRNPFSGFVEQFAEDPRRAPTGQEIARKAGVPDTSMNAGLTTYTNPKTGITIPIREEDAPTLQEAVGLVIDIAADPINLIPGAMLAKPFTKGAQGVRRVGKMFRRGEDVVEAGAEAGARARAGAQFEIGPSVIEQQGKAFDFKAPESLDELRAWNPTGAQSDLVSKHRLSQIENVVKDLEVKPLKYHYSMLDNPKKMKELKLHFENLPTADAQKIAAYNQAMVNEAKEKLIHTVFELSNGNPRSLTDAGFDFIESMKTQYATEREALGPMFQEIQRRSNVLDQDAARGLIVNLAENSKIGKLLTQDPQTGRLFLMKNTPRTGLSDREYQILSRLVDDLNDGMTFTEMQAARDFLRKAIDPMNPRETAEIGKVRSLMLGQMEEMTGSMGDDVGSVFKKYAINERARESVEKIIGGKIETLDAMFAANPDKVVKKIFANPNHAEVVRGYIGAEKFQELVGSFLYHGVTKATDSVHGFQPHKFKTWLKSNHQFLEANLSAAEMDRVLALTDYAVLGQKFIAEVNPSGTAASLKAMIEPQTMVQRISQGA